MWKIAISLILSSFLPGMVYLQRPDLNRIVENRVSCILMSFTLKIVLTSIEYLLFLTQGKETNFRGHKLTQNKVQKNKRPRESPKLARKI